MSFAFSLVSMSLPVLPLSYLFLHSSQSYVFYNRSDQETFLLKTFCLLLSHFFLSSLNSNQVKWPSFRFSKALDCPRCLIPTKFCGNPALLTTSGKLSLSCSFTQSLNIVASQKQSLTTWSNADCLHSCPSLGPIHFLLDCIIIHNYMFINLVTSPLFLTPPSYLLLRRRRLASFIHHQFPWDMIVCLIILDTPV